MRCACAVFLTLALLAALAAPVAAHRVNVFAFVDGGEIAVECAFSRGRPAREGKVEVLDAVSGALLLHGLTNAEGIFRFPIPQTARDAGHDLLIRVNAGEGHQNGWRVAAADFTSAPAGAAPANTALAEGGSPRAGTVPPSAPQDDEPISLSSQELERMVKTVLNQELAPIKRMLAEEYEAGPSLRDVVGGLGWLVGLAGLAAYFRARGREK